MTKKLSRLLSILALCFVTSIPLHAQEIRSGADFSDVDPGLAKQIARDKQLLEIWKDHVRKLTQERDEAYQKIEELKSSQASIAPLPAPVQDTAALDTALQEKESALREADTLRSQVASLKTQISKLEIQGANRQFAVEVAPVNPGQNPASQKFYADLSKNYMLQQESIKKLKAEVTRLESEKTSDSEEQNSNLRSENETLQKRYDEALSRIQALESENVLAKEGLDRATQERNAFQKTAEEKKANLKSLEAVLAQVNAEKSRISQELEQSGELQAQVAKLESDKEGLEKDYRQALDEIQEFDSQKALFKEEIVKLGSENQALRKNSDEISLKTDALKSRAQNAENELQKTNANNRALQELIDKLKAEAGELRDQKAAADRTIQELNARIENQTAKAKETETGLRNNLAKAEESARQAGEAREDLAAQNEALKEKLNSNAADIQNLKENFDTMLEPLLSSFDDRKKVV